MCSYDVDSLLTDFLIDDTIAIYFTARYHSVIPNTEVEEGQPIMLLQNALRKLSVFSPNDMFRAH